METVAKCEKIKDWNGKPIYKIEMTNGATAESFAVEIPVGTSETELVFTPNQNPNYADKVKWNKPNAGGVGWKGGNRAGNESFALSYAKDILVAAWTSEKIEKPMTTDQMMELAERLYTWLEAKKK